MLLWEDGLHQSQTLRKAEEETSRRKFFLSLPLSLSFPLPPALHPNGHVLRGAATFCQHSVLTRKYYGDSELFLPQPEPVIEVQGPWQSDSVTATSQGFEDLWNRSGATGPSVA